MSTISTNTTDTTVAKLYDVSRTISPTLKVWEGDTPFTTHQTLSLANHASVNLFTLNMTAHCGTHADAPYHYAAEGKHPAQMPLEKYVGRAHVVSITRQHGGIVPADLGDKDFTGLERLLIRTWVSDLPDNEWPRDFPYPTLELVDWMAERGCVLLGVDMPSVDAYDSKDLACHHRLHQHGIVNLETLCLAGVPDGVYELTALPLKLDGVCASPVRAILRVLD